MNDVVRWVLKLIKICVNLIESVANGYCRSLKSWRYCGLLDWHALDLLIQMVYQKAKKSVAWAIKTIMWKADILDYQKPNGPLIAFVNPT